MFLLALARGQGSTIWVTLSVATESPPPSKMVSRRSRYSEQPASAASSAASASVRSMLLDGRIGSLLRQIEHVPGERTAAGVGEAGRGGRECDRLRPRDLGLAEQEEVRIVRRQRVVGRCPDHVTRARRTHEMRRDDDDKIGLVLLIGFAGEQRAQYRHAAESGQLIDRVLVVALQQPAEHKTLSIAQLDRGRSAPHEIGRATRLNSSHLGISYAVF